MVFDETEEVGEDIEDDEGDGEVDEFGDREGEFVGTDSCRERDLGEPSFGPDEPVGELGVAQNRGLIVGL